MSGQIIGGSAIVGSETSSIVIGTNIGNGVAKLASPATSQAAVDGDYLLTATDATHFSVQTPDGREIGPLAVGSPFDKQIKLAIAAGGAAFAAGDTFKVRVGITNPDAYLFAAFDPNATDGTEKAAGIAIYRVQTTVGSTVKSPDIVRHAVVSGKGLPWPAGITPAHNPRHDAAPTGGRSHPLTVPS